MKSKVAQREVLYLIETYPSKTFLTELHETVYEFDITVYNPYIVLSTCMYMCAYTHI